MNASEDNSEAYLPHGIYKKFQTTSDTIFGGKDAENARRQARCIEKYLGVLVKLVMQKFEIDSETAEMIVLKFIAKLFDSEAIRMPVWGKFRYWIGKSLIRFTRKELEKKLSHAQKLVALGERICDFVLDDVCGFEERQIRKSLASGAMEDELSEGIATGELAKRDVRIAMMEWRDMLPRADIAEKEGVDVSTVSRTMKKILKYSRRHAKRLRFIVNNM